MSYSLNSLMQIREQNKNQAEKNLKSAQELLDLEKARLCTLKDNFQNNQKLRSDLQDTFLKRAQEKPLNKNEASLLASIYKKNLQTEKFLAESLKQQNELVKEANSRMDSARKATVEARTQLKIINKHKDKWLYEQKKLLSALADKQNDDLNAARFTNKRPNKWQ